MTIDMLVTLVAVFLLIGLIVDRWRVRGAVGASRPNGGACARWRARAVRR